MKTLIINIALICMLTITVIGWQSSNIINSAGIEITANQNFTLNTEATFRLLTELRSLLQPLEYSEKLPEWYYKLYRFRPWLSA